MDSECNVWNRVETSMNGAYELIRTWSVILKTMTKADSVAEARPPKS